jgi:hypothetical protein
LLLVLRRLRLPDDALPYVKEQPRPDLGRETLKKEMALDID